MTNSKAFVTFLTFLYHFVPVAIVDLGLFVCGKKPKLLDTYRKIHKLCDVLSYFTNRIFHFNNNNVKNLWAKLDDRDKELFYFDMEAVDWAEFIQHSMFGIRTYLMKEDPKNIPAAIKRFQRFKIIHYTTVYIFRATALYLLYKLVAKFLVPAL